MVTQVGDIVAWLEQIAPPIWAEEGDNVGLQVGSRTDPAARVMTALGVSDDVITQAEAAGVQLIVAHHPLIFRPLVNMCGDDPKVGLVSRLITSGISLYVAHTNLDVAPDGVGQWAADDLGLKGTSPLVPVQEELYKLVIFVPESHVKQVRDSICGAGAGHIGNYSSCTFGVTGTGSFLPLSGTNPYIGAPGQLEQVAEVRLETVVPAYLKGRVLKAMLTAHPYEEPAYDYFRLELPGRLGYGRVGRLDQPTLFVPFAQRVAEAFSVKLLRVAGPKPHKVTKVAVLNGSGARYLAAAKRSGADVYVTGDLKHHEAEEAALIGLCTIDVGHFATESMIPARLAAYLGTRAENSGLAAEFLVAREADFFSTITP